MTAKMTATAANTYERVRTITTIRGWGLRVFRHGVSGRLSEDQGVSIDREFMTQPSQGVSNGLTDSPGHGVK